MTGVLVDTHALLWFLFDDPRMTAAAAGRIEDPASRTLVSVASLWEIAIKNQIGRLDLGMPFDAFVATHLVGSDLDLVGVEVAHLLRYSALPLHHRDPFDRLLVAQALALEVPILTADPQFAAYGVQVLWS